MSMFGKMKVVEEYDLGRTVLCDICNGNWTDRGECGGFLMGSYAVCPECAPRIMESLRINNELDHIKGRCLDGVSYADWVRDLRAQRPEGNKVRFLVLDEDDV